MAVNRAQRIKNSQAFRDMLGYLVAKPDAKPAPLDDVYGFAKVKPEKGKWYFVVPCPDCQAALPLFEDPSNGLLGNPFTGPGGFRAPCYHCRKDVVAVSHEARAVEWT
jgi:hypothetical protein